MRCLNILIIVVSILLITISSALSNDSYVQTEIINRPFTVGDTVEPYREFDGGWRILNETDGIINTEWYVVAITDKEVTLRLTSGRYRGGSGNLYEVGHQGNWDSSYHYNSYFPDRPKTDQIFKMFRRVEGYFEDIVYELTKLSIPSNAAEIITLKNIQFRGNVKNDLINLCKKEDFHNSYCNFDNNGKMNLGDFKYGNLIANPGQASVIIGLNGELLAYNQSFDRKMVSELEKILALKYGKPISKVYRYNNDLSVRYYWKDINGTVIVINNPNDRLNMSTNISGISIISSFFIDKINRTIAESEQKYKKELDLKHQDGLKNL